VACGETALALYRAEDGDSMFFRNSGIYQQVHAALKPERPTSILQCRDSIKKAVVLIKCGFTSTVGQLLKNADRVRRVIHRRN
jgi:hypothetical protein